MKTALTHKLFVFTLCALLSTFFIFTTHPETYAQNLNEILPCETFGEQPSSALDEDEEESLRKWSRESLLLMAHYMSAAGAPSPILDPYYTSSDAWNQGYDDMWGLKRIGVENVWDLGFKGEGVIVAVLDSGLDLSHPELVNNLWLNMLEFYGVPGVDDDGNGIVDDINGWDYVNSDNNITDDYGHGTHVAGILGAEQNEEGIIGITPNIKIMGLKVLDNNGFGDLQDLASAIYYAVNHGAQIINMSLAAATGVMPLYLSKAIDYAYKAGCVLVAAAGNASADVANYIPANSDKVITVSATEHGDTFADYSNYGNEIDVTAPGSGILSLHADGTDMYGDGNHYVPMGDSDALYYWANGTSMATPFVAGLAALLYQSDWTRSSEEIMRRILGTAEDIGAEGFDNYLGYGMIDATSALNENLFDILDYGSVQLDDLSTAYKTPADVNVRVEVTGTKDIRGVTTFVEHNTDGTEEGDDYITFDENGYRLHGIGADFDDDGDIDEVIFDEPLLLCPRMVTNGETYTDTVTFSFDFPIPFPPWTMTVNYTATIEVIVHGLEDIVLDSGLVVKNALKLEIKLTIEDSQGLGDKRETTYTSWMMKNVGEVKNDNGTDQTYARTALLHYESGMKKAELLETAEAGFIYREYLDEDFNSRGYGRVKKLQREDGTFELLAYWPETENVRKLEEYNADGKCLFRMEFYESGAIWSVTNFDLSGAVSYPIYTYYHEDFDSGLGREYALQNSADDMHYLYGYVYGTDRRLLEYNTSVVGTGWIPPADQGVVVYKYYDNENSGAPTACQLELDNGLIVEGLYDQADVIRPTKALYPTGVTNWFLWGIGVYQGNDNVVIKKDGDTWTAYTVNGGTALADVLNEANWTLIGTVADPNSLDLPELGDWKQYCIDNEIVPEFPPLASDYTTDGLGRIKYRIDYNPAMITTYNYKWDVPESGQMTHEMHYDYDQDGTDEIIYSWVYINGTDYDLANMPTWHLTSKTNHLANKTYKYDANGRLIKIIFHDTGEFENYYYWDDGTANADNIKQIIRFTSSYGWIWTKDYYYEDESKIKYYSVPDAHPDEPGDRTRTKYDLFGRIIGGTDDDGLYRFERGFWTDDPNDLTIKFLFEYENGSWVRSRLYFPDGVHAEYDQFPDPNPGTGNEGDVVERKYVWDENRYDLLGETLDTLWFTRHYRWPDNMDVLRQVVYFKPSWVWEKSFDLFQNGTHIKLYHLNDPNATDDTIIRTGFDSTGSNAYVTYGGLTLNAGRITYTETKGGYIHEMVYQDPNDYNNTKLSALYEFQRDQHGAKVWVQSTIYHADGTTPSMIQRPDANPGTPGDIVEEYYYADGKLKGEKFDDEVTGDFTRITYSGETMSQVVLFGAGWVWKETLDLHPNGTHVKYFHIPDPDPNTVGNIALTTKYDTVGSTVLTYGSVTVYSGRVIGETFDSGSSYTQTYWNDTESKIKQKIKYQDGEWRKTTDFWEDGTTPHYEHFADLNPGTTGDIVYKKYDINGTCILIRYDDGTESGPLGGGAAAFRDSGDYPEPGSTDKPGTGDIPVQGRPRGGAWGLLEE